MNSPAAPLWADLHNHNAVTYGQGSLERSYRIAENSLDVYALTIHGHWPDPPADDPKMASYHAEALERANLAFPEVVRQANLHYRPGQFVALVGYEWHSTAWGDYVVLFPGDAGTLDRAPTLGALQDFVRRQGGIMIPHHVGYRRGLRGLDWRDVDFGLSPLVEICSEHGSSWDADGTPAMLSHSMGGITASQSILAQLAAGRHFGFTAGTDTHFGYPGSYGEGITGIYAGARTRESVFDALRRRHTFAATGDRIEIWAEANGALPGDAVPASGPRSFQVTVDPLGPLDYVEVIKNGVRAHLWPCSPVRDAGKNPGPHLLRIDWGWGRMASADDTDWKLRLKVSGGDIRRIVPCFNGGPGSVEKINLIRRVDAASAEIESFTTRRDPLPINGVVLEIMGDARTRVSCSAAATVGGQSGGCELSATLADLGGDDVWGAVMPRFSSPRLRLGHAWSKSALHFAGVYRDENPGRRDTYVFKARQVNGQMAWTSPILFDQDAD